MMNNDHASCRASGAVTTMSGQKRKFQPPPEEGEKEQEQEQEQQIDSKDTTTKRSDILTDGIKRQRIQSPPLTPDNNNNQNNQSNKLNKAWHNVSSKRICKQIASYGAKNNINAALDLLYESYPQLKLPLPMKFNDETSTIINATMSSSVKNNNNNNNSTQQQPTQSQSNTNEQIDGIDARIIGAVIHMFGRVNQPKMAFQLVQQVFHIYDQRNQIHHQQETGKNTPIITPEQKLLVAVVPEQFFHLHQDDMLLIYKAIIHMLGETYSSSSTNVKTPTTTTTASTNTENHPLQILEILQYDIPKQCHSPAKMDMYHAAISSLGKCKRMDLVCDLLKDMELNSERTVSTRNNEEDFEDLNIVKSGTAIVDTQQTRSTSPTTASHQWKYQLPKPDQMAYLTALTASIRSKTPHISIQLLRQNKIVSPNLNVNTYNQVLASIAKSGKRNIQVQDVYSDTKDSTTNTTTTTMTYKPRHKIALEILKEMEENQTISPNQATYDNVMSICGKEGDWESVAQLSSRRGDKHTVVSNANSRQSQKNITTTTKKSTNGPAKESLTTAYIRDLGKLEKVGKSKAMWYKLGTFEGKRKGRHSNRTTNSNVIDEANDNEKFEFEFGIQTHKNPGRNGLSIVFFEKPKQDGPTNGDGMSNEGTKLGFILVKNSVSSLQKKKKNEGGTPSSDENNALYQHLFFSSIIGMYIEEEHRGKGLANVFLAVWLRLCLKVDIALPRSEIINKPLLSLVLSKFGFIPDEEEKCIGSSKGNGRNSSGVVVEVSPFSHVPSPLSKESQSEDNDNYSDGKNDREAPQFALYSPTFQPLEGCFSERDLRIQKMIISKVAPNPRGKTTMVRTSFEHPLTTHMATLSTGEHPTPQTRDNKIDELKNLLEQSVEEVLSCGELELGISDVLLKRVLFGFGYRQP